MLLEVDESVMFVPIFLILHDANSGGLSVLLEELLEVVFGDIGAQILDSNVGESFLVKESCQQFRSRGNEIAPTFLDRKTPTAKLHSLPFNVNF